MKRYIRSTSQFATYQLKNSSFRSVISSHIFIGAESERAQIADELFQMIDDAYEGEGGFKSFKDIPHFISDSYLWYITYDGPQPVDLSEFDVRKVLVVSVFRNRHGLKLVGLARRIIGRSETDKESNMLMRRNANSALYEHIHFLKSKVHGWAEVSGKLERYFAEVYGVEGIIDPYDLQDHNIFNGIDVDTDEMHYYRVIQTGQEPKRKIAYGNIKW